MDIGYYLFTSVKPEVRLLEWQNLLRHYYDNLQKDVQALGGNVCFTFEVSLTTVLLLMVVLLTPLPVSLK